jgi:RNA polymerase sigma factor (sigma-70 family)
MFAPARQAVMSTDIQLDWTYRLQTLRPRILGYAQRLAGPGLAEDILQEVCLRLLLYKDRIPPDLPVGLLLTMTRNVARRMLARGSRRRAEEPRDRIREPEARPTGQVEDSPLLARLLGRLPSRQRDAVVLTTAHGLSEHQASLALRMSRSAIGARRRDGLSRLRLARIENDPTGPRPPGRDH